MRKRATLKVIMRGFDKARPDAPVEQRKNIKAGLTKFFWGKGKENK